MKKVLTVVAILLMVSLLAGCYPRLGGSRYFQTFSSNGERIYYTATSSSGDRITYSGSIQMMHSIACVNCHGADGRGGVVHMMMETFEVPNITWHHLTEEEHDEAGEEEHPPYNEASVKIAILEGLNPAGESLDDEMPRWQMSPQDLQDLVDYLKTLE